MWSMELAVIALAEFFVVAASSLLGGFLLRFHFQKRADHMHTTYEIHFPRGMTHEHVLDFMRTVVTELPRPKFLRPAHTLVLEKYADGLGKHYYLHMPGHVRTNIDQLLDTMIDGVSIERVSEDEDRVARTDWTYALEVTMSGTAAPLRVDDPKRIAASIDAKFKNLAQDEALVLQWVLIPDRPRSKDEGDKDKLSDFTLHAVARMGARGEHGKQLLLNLVASFNGVGAKGSRLQRRLMVGVSDRIQRRAGTFGYPIFLNVREFSGLMGWELDGLAGSRARKLPVDNMVDTQGIVVGSSNHHHSRGRPLAIPPTALLMHTWVLGPSGVGKSTVLHNMAAQIMQQGMGLVVIEPKGDLARDILRSVPNDRIGDVIWFDPADTHYPIGLNVLAGHDPERITGHIIGMLDNMTEGGLGARQRRILRFTVKTAAINGDTLFDCRHYLINPEFRALRIAKVQRIDYELGLEWRWLDSIADTAVDSCINVLDNFLGSRTLRNIVGQRSGLSMADVVENRKILLVPLPSALIGQTNTSALGSLVRELLWDEIRRRPSGHRQPIILMMDEFQNYADLNTTRSDPFAEARSYGLGLVIANQHTAQLPNAVLSSVSNNTASKIVFGLEPEDAKKLKDNFVPLTPDDLNTLPRYGVAARLMTSSGKAPVTTAVTAPAPFPTGAGHAALEASRRAYGRPMTEVQQELAERHRVGSEPRRRPAIGRREA